LAGRLKNKEGDIEMPVLIDNKREMRLLISVSDLPWFKENFSMFKWQAGDTKISWNANDPDEVAMAQKAFEAYKKKHPRALAFSIDKDGNTSAQASKEFDPNAEMIVMQEYAVKG